MEIKISCVTAQDYLGLQDNVRALQTQSARPNIFIDPAIAFAAPIAPDVLVAWQGNALVGAWPLFKRGKQFDADAHLYAMLSFPLLRHGLEAPVMAAFVGHLKTYAKGARALRLRHWPQSALGLLPQKAQVLAHDVRGTMTAADGVFSSAALSASTRRSLSKQKNRMEKKGAVAYVVMQGEAALAQLPSFFALEGSGWKGKRRTAIASQTANTTFITRVVQHLDAQDVMLSSLSVGTDTLAAGLVLHAAGHYWFWKIAYDERAARLSPGVHYAKALCEDISGRAGFVAADSCAPLSAGRHVAFCKTPDYFVDVIMPLDDLPSIAFRVHVMMLRSHQTLKQKFKRLLRRNK